MVKLLLKIGKVDVDLKNIKYSQMPLLQAVEGGHKAVVKLLLKMGKVDIDLKNNSSQMPLLWAAERGHKAVVKLLLKMGKVDINLKDKVYGQMPLLQAIE